MSGISLTASMRSNLLSLQNISGQVSSTQNKLSTGNKVNSAIDNPSSYYTALSLNNRADDLNALLDSMGQAVSTIKAATTALESATDFLEQATAVATQVNCSGNIPDKSYFEEKVGENGAVVTTAQELKDAIAAGKETICVYGAIDLGDISTTGGLTLQENQKLVGVGYYGNFSGGKDFSSITASANTKAQNLITISKTGNLVSDLSVDYKSSLADTNGYAAIRIDTNAEVDLKNLNIDANFTAIRNRGKLELNGNFSIETKAEWGHGILSEDNSICNVDSETCLNIKTVQASSKGIWAIRNAVVNIASESSVRIKSNASYGIHLENHAIVNIASNANVYVESTGTPGILVYSSTLNVGGNLECKGYISTISNVNDCYINIENTACVYFNNNTSSIIIGFPAATSNPNILDIAAGARIAFEKNGATKWYEVQSDYNYQNTSGTNFNISYDNVESILNVANTNSWQTAKDVIAEQEQKNQEEENNTSLIETANLLNYQAQYNKALSQYDSLIKDARYKGINLLQPEKLTVKFNEDSSSDLSVQGKDMSSKALGFTIFDWQTQGDINKSIEELTSAINSIRNYSSELGNNYNIITTRQDFTESLINVLTEGADKLTLADMNEESANMLALQTRQQLAINSLSLASQASQSILKLF